MAVRGLVKGKVIVEGVAEGSALKISTPFSFLGDLLVDKCAIRAVTGEISVKDRILLLERVVGSTVNAYLAMIAKEKCGVRAIAMKQADIAVASGCAVADLPLLLVSRDLAVIHDNVNLFFDAVNGFIHVID